MPFEPGTVVLFKDQEGLVVAAVLRVSGQRRTGSGRGLSLEMLTEKDRTVRLPDSRVLADLGRMVDPAARRSELVTALVDIHRDIAERACGIDSAELWELAVDDMSGAVVWQELADLVVDPQDRLGQAAVLEALWADRTHFRQRKEGRFELRRAEDVAQMEEQQRAERRKAETRQRFVDLARRALAGDQVEPPGDWAGPLIGLLSGLALHEDDFPGQVQAMALLKDIGGTKGRPKDAAFDIMVALGLWDEDEELCLLRYDVSPRFSDIVLAEAEAAAEESVSTRGQDSPVQANGSAASVEVDLFAIDDPDTTEIDDAVGIAATDSGYLLTVAIADLASFVEPGGAMDQAALRRGRTIYLPSRKILMIPPQLAEGRASLLQGEPRPVLLFEARLDSDGHMQGYGLRRTHRAVSRTLSYQDADRHLSKPARQAPPDDRPLAEALHAIHALAQALRKRRLEEGGLALDADEVKVKVGPDGEISVHRIEGASPSRLLVSESMILANRLAATFCRDHDLPCVYQVQDPPGEELPLAEQFPTPRSYYHAVRRRLKRARTSLEPERHYALGIEPYCQATSPLRRYGDLQIEHQLGFFFATGQVLLDRDKMQRAAATAEQSAHEAALCERESKRYWLLKYLATCTGPFEAEVVHEEHDGAHLLELSETLVTVRLAPRGLKLGERVSVAVEKVDPRRDILVVRIL